MAKSERRPLLGHSTSNSVLRFPVSDGKAKTQSTFTWTGLSLGLGIGCFYCFSNTYFGLRAGQIAGSSPATTFLVRTCLPSLTDAEIIFAVSVAGSMSVMPIAGGFAGPIPALQFLIGPSERSPLDFSWISLLIWTFGVSVFGLLFAMIVREKFVLGNLPFPSAMATVEVITSYRGCPATVDACMGSDSNRSEAGGDVAEEDETIGESEQGEATNTSYEDRGIDPPGLPQESVIFRQGIFVNSLTFSTILSFAATYFPILPLFGHTLASYYWYVELSSGVIGQGMILGVWIAYELSWGAVLGWGLLAPIAHSQGWAPSDINSWENGARGWMLWPALAALLSDCAVDIAYPVTPVEVAGHAKRNTVSPAPTDNSNPVITPGSGRAQCPPKTEFLMKPHSQTRSGMWYLYLLGCVVATYLCIPAVQNSIGPSIPGLNIVLAVGISVPLSYAAILITGKTDSTPVSALGRFPQFIFGALASKSNPQALVISLITGGIAEAAATQASSLIFDLKAGYMIHASAEVLFAGQIAGTMVAAFACSGFYKMFTYFAHSKPGSKYGFDIPSARAWAVVARLSRTRQLPPMALEVSLLTTVVFTGLAILKKRVKAGKVKWFPANRSKWIPSGAAVAQGMFNLPSVTMMWVIGGVVRQISVERKVDETAITLLASGLMLGQSIGAWTGTLSMTSAVPDSPAK